MMGRVDLVCVFAIGTLRTRDIEGPTKMLADQDLEDSKLNRTVIEWATFYPVQVYLSLLYAEIEYIRKNRDRSALLVDSNAFSYFDRNHEAISKLQRFRSAFLHPVKPDSAELEVDFLAYGQSYNAGPEIQNAVDEYLYRLRGRLISQLGFSAGYLNQLIKGNISITHFNRPWTPGDRIWGYNLNIAAQNRGVLC